MVHFRIGMCSIQEQVFSVLLCVLVAVLTSSGLLCITEDALYAEHNLAFHTQTQAQDILLKKKMYIHKVPLYQKHAKI